ncbi:MAG: FAD-dependent oxidoreductase [bacterium]
MEEFFDVVVVGGGVNGTGIARDLAMRGVKTLLLEKRDFSSGATGGSSGMIHGGLRYLLYDIDVTRHSCIDSGYIQQIAPHMLFRIPFIMPLPHRLSAPFFKTYFEVYDKYAHYKRGKPSTLLSREKVLEIMPVLDPRIQGAVTTDEWGIDPQRLCAANALAAFENGAAIRNHTEVVEFMKDHAGNVVGVKTKDRFGHQNTIKSRIVMHATGPWLSRTSLMAGVNVKIRPGKGVHLTFDRRLTNMSVILSMIDGRSSFFMPHENTSVLGTTDDDYYGDLDDLRVTEDEIEYLLEGAERMIPSIREARIIRAWAAIRPTLYAWGKDEDALSRDHMVCDHEKLDGVSGIVSIAGGKLASYRMMSEEAADLVADKLGVSAKCRTHEVPLPGGEKTPDPAELARRYGVSAYAASRMVYRHGNRAEQILELTRERPELKTTVCQCEPVLACELVYSIRKEWAVSLTDLRNRTRLGTGPCQGARCASRAMGILAKELGLSGREIQEQILSFLERRWRGKRPILDGTMIDQEEMNQAAHFLAGNLRNLAGIKGFD